MTDKDDKEKPTIKNAKVTINGIEYAIKPNSASWVFSTDSNPRKSHVGEEGNISDHIKLEINVPLVAELGQETTKGDGTLEDWKKHNRVVKKKF